MTARVWRAGSGYRLALEERTREQVPLDWAKTQMNLGTALPSAKGARRETGRLEKAVAAYRLALEVKRRRAPRSGRCADEPQ